jgi:hypothetical protein
VLIFVFRCYFCTPGRGVWRSREFQRGGTRAPTDPRVASLRATGGASHLGTSMWICSGCRVLAKSQHFIPDPPAEREECSRFFT